MNKELYLNETTKVGVVVQDENELKTVESSENEYTYRILSLQNEIERENKYVNMLKDTLFELKLKNFIKVFTIVCSMILAYLEGATIFDMFKWGWSCPWILLIADNALIVTLCLWGTSCGKFKQNNVCIKKMPTKIKQSKEKIKELETKLEKLKENSNYNETVISDEYVEPLNIIDYPQRINEELVSYDIKSPAKIKKIIFNHDGTTK